MRRHITLRFRDVIGVEDEVLDIHSDEIGKASQQGTLTGEGALLASLGSRRTGKMTDIVATIQAEQDRIIRAPLDHTIVVQEVLAQEKQLLLCTEQPICYTLTGANLSVQEFLLLVQVRHSCVILIKYSFSW